MDRCQGAGTQLTGTTCRCAHGASLKKHRLFPPSFHSSVRVISMLRSGSENTALVALCLQPPARTDCIVEYSVNIFQTLLLPPVTT